jgi:phage terminase small subunit
MNTTTLVDAPANVLSSYHRLNDKQRAFALALPLASSQKAAARLAGYAPKTAEAQAFKLAKHPDVTLVAKFVTEKAMQSVGVSIERALKELADVAFLDPGVIFDERNCVKPIGEWPESARRAVSSFDVTEYPNGSRTVKVRFLSKIEAADKLLRALGAYASDKVHHNHRVKGLAALLEELSKTGADTGPAPSSSRRYLTAM